MPRIAFIFVFFLMLPFLLGAMLVGTFKMAAGKIARNERSGIAALTNGGAMQKIAFFLLLCLIMYVSLSGTT